ncbi:MAG: GNAT family N-acetyltransferase [Gammaproteobacteria bacterium]|nr:GNAT family N-acetyltransferase [Gammaproteobacteria bacterium]
MHYRIEPIRKEHIRKDFDCGRPFLNDYLQQFARQNHNNGVARAFVLVPEDKGNPVIGYYTISAGALEFKELPDQFARRLPHYPIPVARIGELAVDDSLQGEGLGPTLLFDAFMKIAHASEEMAVWAIVVDPIDNQATSFYQHFGFEPLRDSDALFITMRDVAGWL